MFDWDVAGMRDVPGICLKLPAGNDLQAPRRALAWHYLLKGTTAHAEQTTGVRIQLQDIGILPKA